MKFGDLKNYLDDGALGESGSLFEQGVHFGRVQEEARSLVSELAETDLSNYSKEIERLAPYLEVNTIPSPTMFSSPKRDFRQFLREMSKDPKIASQLSEHWISLAKALDDKNSPGTFSILAALNQEVI